MNFIKYLQSETVLSDRALSDLGTITRSKTYAKRAAILPAENKSKQIYFIEKGMARVFYYRENKDVTLYF